MVHNCCSKLLPNSNWCLINTTRTEEMSFEKQKHPYVTCPHITWHVHPAAIPCDSCTRPSFPLPASPAHAPNDAHLSCHAIQHMSANITIFRLTHAPRIIVFVSAHTNVRCCGVWRLTPTFILVSPLHHSLIATHRMIYLDPSLSPPFCKTNEKPNANHKPSLNASINFTPPLSRCLQPLKLTPVASTPKPPTAQTGQVCSEGSVSSAPRMTAAKRGQGGRM